MLRNRKDATKINIPKPFALENDPSKISKYIISTI